MWQKLLSGHPSLQIFFTCVSVFLKKLEQIKHTDILRAPICHGVFTTRTGLCLGKLNFRALFSTDMEASLRNEPIKMKYKIRQRKIKGHLKVENTIFDIFQVFWFCWLLCGTKKIFYIRFKNVLKINWLVKTPWQDYIAWNLLAPVSKNGLLVLDIKFTQKTQTYYSRFKIQTRYTAFFIEIKQVDKFCIKSI